MRPVATGQAAAAANSRTLRATGGGHRTLLDRSIIAEILAKTDIVALIGNHVSLRRRGQHFVGLCPFHTERSPSFHVRHDRGYFKCFGCGVGGDAIRFIERIENLPFVEAAKFLAKRAGVEIVEEFSPQAQEKRELREAIYEANHVATQFFHRMLLTAPEAEGAREYCRRRAIDAASIERFTLGYAPNSWSALADELRRAGVAEDIALQAGLLKEGQRGAYDFYRDRLMIPTSALTGEIVAFGGRALGDEEPKYLNTATTPVYTKGRLLFGLAQARRAVGTAGAFIVVEGYLDCIALHRAGFTHAVASLGTAFTPEQAQLLKRFSANIYLAFDADRAGQGAMHKSLEAFQALQEAECRVRVVELPAGEDPDSLIRAGGPEAFAKVLEKSRRGVEVMIDYEIDKLDDNFHDDSDRATAAEAIVRRQPRAEWDRWRVYVAEKLRLPINDLRRAMTGPLARPVPMSNPGFAAAPPVRPPVPLPPRERDILRILADDPALVRDYRDRIGAERFRDTRLRRLYTLLAEAEQLESNVDVLVLVQSDPVAEEALFLLTSAERSVAVRFADSDARRSALDDILGAYAREDDERERRRLAEEIDRCLVERIEVPPELLARHHELQTKLVRVLRPS